MKRVICLFLFLNMLSTSYCLNSVLAPNSQINDAFTGQDPGKIDKTFPVSLIRAREYESSLDSGSMDGTIHRVYRDEKGGLWLFKKYPTSYKGQDRTHRAFVDEFASVLAKRLHLDTHVAAYTLKLEGNVGAIFEFIDGDRQTLLDRMGRSMDYNKFTRFQILALVKEQVLDWLISNHDPHTKNFLVRKTSNEEIFAIDKSQAFKYFPGDVLSIRYNPNEGYNGKNNTAYMPIYNILLPMIARGQVGKVSLQEAYSAVMEVVREVESISVEEYVKMIGRYVNFRFSSDREKAAFLDLVVKRKNNVRRDFRNLYSSLGLQTSALDGEGGKAVRKSA